MKFFFCFVLWYFVDWWFSKISILCWNGLGCLFISFFSATIMFNDAIDFIRSISNASYSIIFNFPLFLFFFLSLRCLYLKTINIMKCNWGLIAVLCFFIYIRTGFAPSLCLHWKKIRYRCQCWSFIGSNRLNSSTDNNRKRKKNEEKNEKRVRQHQA